MRRRREEEEGVEWREGAREIGENARLASRRLSHRNIRTARCRAGIVEKKLHRRLEVATGHFEELCRGGTVARARER